ncbi:MAG: UDP-2,3-diacylglucosamine diphosphatase LpxI [Verrucomicrobiota bacterium]
MSDLSRFLPRSFDPGAKVTLIAGRGSYPQLTADRIRSNGVDLSLIALDGETRDELFESFPKERRRKAKVGQIGKLVKYLKVLETRYVVMVGQIQPGRLFKGLHPDLRAIKILASLKEKNAATIFGAIVAEIEAAGCEVLDARAFLDEDLASVGTMTGFRSAYLPEHLDHGIKIGAECARLHIGQSILVRKGTVLAVEAFEGTDQMIQRGGSFKTDQKILVKMPHPDHDFRFDVPVFGMTTLETLKEAGVTTAALAANKTIILNKKEVLTTAHEYGIEILGFS